MAGRGGTVGVP